MKITGLYFGVKRWDFNKKEFVTYNLFNNLTILRSIAVWKTLSRKDQKLIGDPLRFLFGATWGRVEWEFEVSPVFEKEPWDKVDVFSMYVEPNRELLLKMVDSVSKKSAKTWLKNDKKDILAKKS